MAMSCVADRNARSVLTTTIVRRLLVGENNPSEGDGDQQPGIWVTSIHPRRRPNIGTT